MISIAELQEKAINLLEKLIETESFSREEKITGDIIQRFLELHNIPTKRLKNNIWAVKDSKNENAKTILLNSHHDTVKPGKNWNTDPFTPTWEGDKLIGLGSNDAGASLVGLMVTFIYLNQFELPYNLIFAASAEEEISGVNGMRLLYPELGNIDLAIVGEPTQMRMAIAEKGLIVLDCEAHGKTGHAARDEGENALYIALDDINYIRNYKFEKVSEVLGPNKVTVTQINSGTQHNVVPDHCHFVVDIRTNEHYKNIEIINHFKENLSSKITPRSYHLNSSFTPKDHSFVLRGKAKGIETFGSPTLSDQSLILTNSIKIGIGESARSHTPNEYVLKSEIEKGIEQYIDLLMEFEF